MFKRPTSRAGFSSRPRSRRSSLLWPIGEARMFEREPFDDLKVAIRDGAIESLMNRAAARGGGHDS